MNAARATESQQERETARLAARSCYREAIGFAVATFTDQKSKPRDRMLAALVLVLGAEWSAGDD